MSIECHPGHGLGQARREGGGAGDVAGLCTDVVETAEDDVVDSGGVEVVAPNEGGDDVGGEVDRVGGGETAAPLSDRGSHGVDDVRLEHRISPRERVVGQRVCDRVWM